MIMNKRFKGQGTVEYAGAIVVAVAIVAAVLNFAPDAMKGMFETIINTISTFLKAAAVNATT